jgi:hypothetical protein
MPTTLTSLDLSDCYLYGFNVDFDVCLPRLETLRANGTEVRGRAQKPPLLWYDTLRRVSVVNMCCTDAFNAF